MFNEKKIVNNPGIHVRLYIYFVLESTQHANDVILR